ALVVVGSGMATALLAGIDAITALELLGGAFVKNRFLALFLLTLPVIAVLERHGLRAHAQAVIVRLRGATAGRLLLVYLGLRQGLSAIGLHSLGGHPQMVRPLLAPMAEAAAEARHGLLDAAERE